jgi:hypothetical protein
MGTMATGAEDFGGNGQVDTRTYADMLDDDWLDDDQRQIRVQSAIGHTATLLFQRGEHDTARLLLDIPRIEFIPGNVWAETSDSIWIEVAPETMREFKRNAVERMQEAFSEVCDRLGFGLSLEGVREILPQVGPGWQDKLRQQLNGGKRPTNHARRVRIEPSRPVEDYLTFTNEGELTVYRALRKIQETFPSDDTIAIFPLAGGRLPKRTWEPDVLVTYRKRAGVVEIDGPHHNARRALDMSRDDMWVDAGVALVTRIPVQALSDPGEVEATLLKFLKRLAQTS